MLEHLSSMFSIVLVGNAQPAEVIAYDRALAGVCDEFVGVGRRELRRGSVRFYGRVLWRSLGRMPIAASNDYSPTLERAVLSTFAARGPFDVAVCDFVQSARLFRGVRQVPRVLLTHNVEAEIAERHRDLARNPLARWFWDGQARKMTAFERTALGTFDRVIAVSERDRQAFRDRYGITRVSVIATGVDPDFFGPAGDGEPGLVAFCGSMDWLPNEDGVEFFLSAVWPRVRGAVPEARFVVIGRNPADHLVAAASREGVVFTGWVADVRPWLARAQVVVVPLRIGGGTRLKIYEALSMLKPVVATSVGAEGLDVIAGRHLDIADEPDAFAARVVDLLRSRELRDRRGREGRALVEQAYRWERVAEQFAAGCREAMQTGAARQATCA